MDNHRNYISIALEWLYDKKEEFLNNEYRFGFATGLLCGLAVALVVAIVFVWRSL